MDSRFTRFARIALALLCALASTRTARAADVVGGNIEPDYKYPWVTAQVDQISCRAVLIDPRWVLIAAHCVDPSDRERKITYTRMDPYTGAVQTEERDMALVGENRVPAVFIHPEAPTADIALVKLANPFVPGPYIQTVGLPRTPRSSVVGVVGSTASFSHDSLLPPGSVAVFRAPIPAYDGYAPNFEISTSTTTGSLCPGDSGSGFVTLENGRAVVRGIASKASISTNGCTAPYGSATFVDVFTYVPWITSTIAKNDVNSTLNGNTRVSWKGSASRGVIGIGCTNPYGTMYGPLNVAGVEEAANCTAYQTQTVVCSVDSAQTGRAITSFTMKTTTLFSSRVESLPFSSRFASYYGLVPPNTKREFSCTISNVYQSPISSTGGLAVR